jgi:hypothetical protein
VSGEILPDTGVGDVLKSPDDSAVQEVKDHGDAADGCIVPEGPIGVNFVPSEDDRPLKISALDGRGNRTVSALRAT